jgi:hypothetical protein
MLVINKQYGIFMKENPDFNGKISFIGHSLGGLICYDLLSNQNPLDNFPEHVQPHYPQINTHFPIIYPKLDVIPNFLFSLGSPISATSINFTYLLSDHERTMY